MKNRLFPIAALIAVLLVLSLSACSLPFQFNQPATLPQIDPIPDNPTAYTGSVMVPTESSTEAPLSGTASPFRDDPAWAAAQEKAAQWYEEMNNTERICQLFMVFPEALTTEKTMLVMEGWELKYRPVGAVVLQADNLQSPEQTTAMIDAFRKASRLPIFLCTTEEGGRLSPLARKLGTVSLGNMYSYRGDGTEKAYDNARAIARALQSVHFDLNLAPVTDVWSISEIKTIGTRAYSDSFDKAASLISSAVRGYRECDVLCTLKHFPGSGEAIEQEDGTLKLIKKRSLLDKQDWQPFRSGIQAGAELVMVGNILATDLDPVNAAPFSTVVLSVLRNGLDFDGIILADGLLGADNNESAANCVRALAAGCDMLFCPVTSPNKLDFILQTISEALENNVLSWDRIQESVIRVLSIKIYRGVE